MTKIRSEFLNDFIRLDGKFWPKMIFVNNFDIGGTGIEGTQNLFPLLPKMTKIKIGIFFIYILLILLCFFLSIFGRKRHDKTLTKKPKIIKLSFSVMFYVAMTKN